MCLVLLQSGPINGIRPAGSHREDLVPVRARMRRSAVAKCSSYSWVFLTIYYVMKLQNSISTSTRFRVCIDNPVSFLYWQFFRTESIRWQNWKEAIHARLAASVFSRIYFHHSCIFPWPNVNRLPLQRENQSYCKIWKRITIIPGNKHVWKYFPRYFPRLDWDAPNRGPRFFSKLRQRGARYG